MLPHCPPWEFELLLVRSVGTTRVVSDRLNSSVQLGAILYAIDLSILSLMSSEPDNLEYLKVTIFAGTNV